jgi:LuxR family quorum sensing-dependent transcriptional regulator
MIHHSLRHAVSFMGDRDLPSAEELSTLSLFATMLIEQISKISVADHAAKSVLNDREVEILKWTAEGKTSPEIARITGLSEHTVNHYATIATKKLGCSNRTQAVVYAIRLGLFK